MNIRVGKYILRSDPYCLWIEEEYKQKNGKTASKRVAGYATSFSNLMRQFAEARLYGSDADTMEQLISDLRDVMADMVKLNDAAVEARFTKMNTYMEGNNAASKSSKSNSGTFQGTRSRHDGNGNDDPEAYGKRRAACIQERHKEAHIY